MKGAVAKCGAEWAAKCLPADASAEQRRDMLAAFYCGVAGGLGLIVDIARNERLPMDIAVTKLSALGRETAELMATLALEQLEEHMKGPQDAVRTRTDG